MDARNILPQCIHSPRVHVASRGSETRTERLGPTKEKENFDGGGWWRRRRSRSEKESPNGR